MPTTDHDLDGAYLIDGHRGPRRRGPRPVVIVSVLVIALALGGMAFVWHTVQDFAEGFGSSTCKATAASYSAQLDPDQMANAATITAVAVRRRLPARAATIAIATALQESKLRNISYGDRDSVGLFQQRPSQGWGTADQIMDPVYASGRFYDALVKIPGWQTMEITKIAQRVQRSAFPEAYAQHEGEGRALASTLSGHSPGGLGCRLEPLADGDTRLTPAQVATHLRHELQARGTVVGERLRVPTGSAEQAWLVGHWAVAHSQAYGLTSVVVGDREWTRQRSKEGWGWQRAQRPAAARTVEIR
ncbi:hypothetical protein [Arsenicicoccus dermatophilus]|uniref:hypothetical protein n=1 Tax=Arsenicicoccus dermatophilus TaxID=1076331 RepID=UPI001F4D3276|nr:hypothetical protein [Arsenicicoccus dermatophilus]MCH8613682.1 hypothetical protein [Arsenicicoccus dermatophilus]